MAAKLTKEDKKWRAESDARTLSEAVIIKEDRERLRLASEHAKTLANNVREQAKNLDKVSRMKPRPKKSSSRKK
uniref:Uncharacterized protein n=1 Tax=viral metagenome TaxID=1070528 RepID=A0A6M3KC71_9ZZZZ